MTSTILHVELGIKTDLATEMQDLRHSLVDKLISPKLHELV